MKKYIWLIVIVLIAIAILFNVMYKNYRIHQLPTGGPAERPLQSR